MALLSISLLASGLSQGASAQIQAGGVNKEGSWYIGEGLKKGDQFTTTYVMFTTRTAHHSRLTFGWRVVNKSVAKTSGSSKS